MNSRNPPGPPEGPLQPQGRNGAARPSRSWRSILTHTGTALVSLLVGVLIGLTGNPNTDKASPSATVTTTATATQIAAANSQPSAGKVPSDGIPGDGTYLVGSDIKPGTYRSEGKNKYGCYWARLSDTTGEGDAIIANGNAEGPAIVKIAAGDRAFQTTDCKPWEKIN